MNSSRLDWLRERTTFPDDGDWFNVNGHTIDIGDPFDVYEQAADNLILEASEFDIVLDQDEVIEYLNELTILIVEE